MTIFRECNSSEEFYVLNKGEGLVRGDKGGLFILAEEFKKLGFPYQALMLKDDEVDLYAIKMLEEDYRAYAEIDNKKYER